MDDYRQTNTDAWYSDLEASAVRLQRKGRLPSDLAGLARKAESISAELDELAPCYAGSQPASLQTLCAAAVNQTAPNMQLADILGENTQAQMEQSAGRIRQLSAAYREAAGLLRAIAAPDADATQLRPRALYWLKELNDHSGVMMDSLKQLRTLDTAFNEKVMGYYEGRTPWEQKERDEEIAQGLESMIGVDKDEIRRYVKQASRRISQQPHHLFEAMLHEVINTTRQVHADMRGERTAGDIMLAIAYRLRTPNEKRARE